MGRKMKRKCGYLGTKVRVHVIRSEAQVFYLRIIASNEKCDFASTLHPTIVSVGYITGAVIFVLFLRKRENEIKI